MRKIFFIFVLTHAALALLAQKQPLNMEAIKNWPQLTNEMISSDGKLVVYNMGIPRGADTLVVQTVDKGGQTKIPGGSMPVITENSQSLIYRKNDSLFIYDVYKHAWKMSIGHMVSFKTAVTGNDQWLAYLLDSADNILVLRNCTTGKIFSYDNVLNYQFSANGRVLVLHRILNEGDNKVPVVQWIDLPDVKMTTITRSAQNIRIFSFDEPAMQLAFTADETVNGKTGTVLRYYQKGMDSAIVRVNDHTPGMHAPYIIAPAGVRFSQNGNRIFFKLKKAEEKSAKVADMADVNVWHYDDDYLPTEQATLLSFETGRTYTAVSEKNATKIIQIDQEGDDRYIDTGNGNGDFAVVPQNTGNGVFAGTWKASTMPVYCVVNMKTGERKQVVAQRNISICLSPEGKYVIWYDPEKSTWLSYETLTGLVKDITAPLAGSLCPAAQAMQLRPFLPFGIAGWQPGDKAVLIYDEFDIWKIDLSANTAPVNITNGYGKLHHIVLRVWNEDNNDYAMPVVHNGNMLLVAFDNENKNNGFFKINPFSAQDPVRCSLDPCMYYAHLRFNQQFMTKYGIHKAKNAEAYILRKMSSCEYPNICFTRNFKEFTTLSNLHPERAYNWLTTELIAWKLPDGTTGQGILYKPENFDANKKYPVIFYIYERMSHRLHQFLQPELSRGSIDIPSFVSNGYLVCTPDISYVPGTPGESVCNTVVAAARYLGKMPWIDSSRMGIQGHSFGGYQVNYIVSHTDIFAAAQESAGASDFISYYNSFYREHSAQFYFENGQGRMGYTLWQKPELYTKNSPIFRADQVQTPLLIMHNQDDGEVPFQQGIEWFTALRRLGKKVWLLQYDGEYHGINQKKNQTDFTVRVAQFFDHYLKGMPAPKWMVTGVPVRLKGINAGLELTTGSSNAAR